ncbi:MAG: hypothetical protein QXU32_11970 [Nitrososphaerales archaeon]
MRYIAELIANIYNARKPNLRTQIGRTKKEIEDLAARYNKILYALQSI